MSEPRSKSDYSSLKAQKYLSLADIAYNVLLEAIINQDFQPGAPVSIDSLAKQLNMSNTPVREALMRANGERLVTQKTNHGFVVSEILTPDELHQLFDVRHVLEVHALNTATLNSEAIEKLNALIKQMFAASDGATYDDYKDYLALDHQFHRTLVDLCGSSFLTKAWEDLHVHLHLSRLYTGIGLFDRDDSIKEHQAIVTALEEDDKNQATTLLSQHIKRVGKQMETFLEG